jgi:hypothetical protein
MSYEPMAPPPPPAAATTTGPVVPTKIRPSAAWYWIGGVLIAAGVIGALVILGIWAARASDAVDNFARMKVVPGADQQGQGFNFARAGTYTLYYEYRSSVDGEKIRNPDHDPPRQLQVTVTNEANGTEVPVRSYDKDFAFSVNDKLGPAFARVDIPAPGTYTLGVTSGATSPFVVAIGKGVLQSIWPWWLLGAIAAFVVGVGLGLAAIITTAVKRGRRKREQRRALAAASGYGTRYPGTYAPVPAGGPSWTSPPATTPGWGSPGTPDTPPTNPTPPASPTPKPAPPTSPPGSDDPWGPPRR